MSRSDGRDPLLPGIPAALAAAVTLAGAGCSPPADAPAPAIEPVSVSAGSPPALVIHGGAGAIRREEMPDERDAAYRAQLEKALAAGWAVLEAGGTAVDAVEAAILPLEDSPLFNAGRGAVFTADGRNELDAAIMAGWRREAGAVAGVTTVRNPIRAARAVMERSSHVLLSGPGAEAFAAEAGLEAVAPEYFFTQERWDQLERRRAAEATGAGASPATFGTVGAVARDARGRIAAGTSTGGMTFKRHGRVGDSPIPGAGTWAESACGVSATGHGEFFIRWGVAQDICARASYLAISVAEAARQVIHEVLPAAGGEGGVIALDATGAPVLELNTAGMYRGWIDPQGRPRVAIFRDE